MKRRFATGLCWLVWLSLAHAQSFTESGTTPPASGIVDQGKFFDPQSAVVERISEQILKLKRDHGFKLFLVVEPLLIGATVPQRADELRQRWAPNGDGLVVVYETSSRQLAIGWDIEGRQNTDLAALRRIPSFKTSAMLNRALAGPDSKLPPDAYLESLMGNLAKEFDLYFNERSVSPPPERTLKIAMVVIGTLALLGLASIIAGAVVRFSSISAVQAYHLPSVESTERLAAPCGANVTSRRFSAPKSRE